MRITYYSHPLDTTPAVEDVSWSAWADQIQAVGHVVHARPTPEPEGWERQAKQSNLCFSPAELRVGATRADKDAIAVHFGVLDFDGINPLELELVRGQIRSLGVAALLLTTWKHQSGPSARVRAVLPFADPVPASDTWGGLYARLGALVGCGVQYDTTCKNLTRIYFWPSCPSDRAADAWIERHEGRPLTLDDLLAVPGPTTAAQTAAAGTRRVTRPELSAVRDRLKASHTPTKRACGFALAAVLAGEPWAVEGERDSLLHSLAIQLAAEFPDLDPNYLASTHFAQSCALMGAEFGEGLVAQKLINARRYVAEKDLEREAKTLRDHEVRIQTATLGARTTHYTEADLAQICVELGAQPGQITRRWALQLGDDIWYYVIGRGYVGPVSKSATTPAAHQYLVAAEKLGIALEEPTDRGMRKRSAAEIVGDYGTTLEAATVDLTAAIPTYDAARNVLVEAPCPLRSLEPEYHQGVDQWLRALGGADYEMLARWVAWSTRLDLPCAALFLEGEASAGKSMLAVGLARLWTTAGPTDASEALADFNSAICDCPLIFADEQLPRDWRGRGKTAEIRDLIGATTRQIKRKFRPATRAQGAIRLVVAANNRSILSGEKDLSEDDVKAIRKRFLYIRVGTDAVKSLEQWDTYGDQWVDGDVIAKHALWLRDQITLPERPPRFLIEQTSDNLLSQTMSSASHAGGLVANWLVRFLLEPKQLALVCKGAEKGAHIEGGALYVSSRAIADGWRAYLEAQPLSVNSIGGALRALSIGAKDIRVPGSTGRQRLREVDVRALIAWAEDRGYASGEQITEALEKNQKSTVVSLHRA